MARIFGLAESALTGIQLGQILPADLIEPRDSTGREELDPISAGSTHEILIKRPDGNVLAVAVASRPVLDAEHSFVLHTVSDISERRDIEVALKKNSFYQSPYGKLVIDAHGAIISNNEQLGLMFGYTAEELQGQKVEILVPTRFRTVHVKHRSVFANSASARSAGAMRRDFSGRRKDGTEIPVEIVLSTLMTPAGRISEACVIDITERKRSDRKLREANTQLEEFAYVAAHDLRSPLRGIANLIDFVLEDFGETGPRSAIKNLNRMRDRVRSAEGMIEDLLSYARAGQGATIFETIDLAAMIDEIFAAVPASPGLRLESKVTSEPFEGARSPLSTVVRNLVSNAVKHHDRPDMHVVVKSRDQGDFVAIDVCDDGPGIPQAVQARVFRLFQTLAGSEKKGSGLGLALAQRLVSSNGGRIELISLDGRRGCVFRIWWPRFVRSDLNE